MGGGLAFLIRQDVQFSHLDTNQFFPGDPTTEHQGILANLGGNQIACLNIYIPSCTCCPAGFQPDLAPLLDANYGANVMVMGDFNAHHPAWFSVSRDDRALARGASIAEAIDSSPLCLLNEDSPTRLPPNGTPSSPDLTLISGHLAQTASWLPSISLNSDHLPILINLVEDPQDSLKSQPILHNNYRRADWASYTDFTESAFSALPPPSSCSIGEKSFRNILRDASVRFIPRGSIPNYTPHLSNAAKRLTSEHDRLRATDPQNPEIAILNNHISDELDSSNRSAWTERVMAASPKDNSTKFYSLLCSLSGRKTAVAPNQPIMFGNGSLSNTTSIARAFCKQFTGCSPRRTRASRRLRRLIKRRPLDHSLLFRGVSDVGFPIFADADTDADFAF